MSKIIEIRPLKNEGKGKVLEARSSELKYPLVPATYCMQTSR